MNLTFLQKLKAALLAALLAAGVAVPASGEKPRAASTAAPEFEETTAAERLRQNLETAIADFDAAANEALDEFSKPGDDLCAEIAAEWGQGNVKGLLPVDDMLVVALSFYQGPWSPPGFEDGQDLFFVYRIDRNDRWVPAAVCIRAGTKVLTMKVSRDGIGFSPDF